MTDGNYQSVQYVVTNIPENVSDPTIKRNIQKCFDVQVCDFVRLTDPSAGMITFEDQRDASKVVQMKPSIQKQPLTFNAMCYESTSLCLQGPIIEMVGLQTLVQLAHDLFLACHVDSDKITVHGYWKTVELFRNEANSLFHSFAGQTFTRQTGTIPQTFRTGSKTTPPTSKHTSAYLPPATTASQKMVRTTVGYASTVANASTASVTKSIDHLFTKVTTSPLVNTVTSFVPTSFLQTAAGMDTPATGKGKSLPGGIQAMFPLELSLVRVDPEVTSSAATTTTSMIHSSLSSAGIFLTDVPPTAAATATTSSVISPLSHTGVTMSDLLTINSLNTSQSELPRSPPEVKSKIDAVQLSSGQMVTLKHGDIVKEAVDVIVNPANSFLKHEGGVAKAIDSASDGLVQLFSDELVARDGVVPVGGAKYTQAGGHLKCKYVVHTVGPDARKYNAKECETLLKLACENSLTLAEALKATSIAFPAISAGIFAVNPQTVARIIIKTLLEYKYPSTCCLKDIEIVINDQDLFDAFRNYFAKKRKSMGRTKEKHSSSRPKATPMVADHTATAAARSSILTGAVTTAFSYTRPGHHHRSSSFDANLLRKTKSGATGYTHSYDQLT